MVPSDNAIKPANGPKPNNFTANIASIISGKVLEAAITPLQNKYTQAGAKLRAAPRPIGIDRAIPATVEIIAIQILSAIPSQSTPRLSEKFGGKNESKNL